MVKTGLIFALIGLSGALWLQNRELQSRLSAPQSPPPTAPSTTVAQSCPPAPTPVPCSNSSASGPAPSKFISKEINKAKIKLEERLKRVREQKEKLQALLASGNRQNQLDQKLQELYRLRVELSRATGAPEPDQGDLNPDRSQQNQRIRELQTQLSRLKPPQPGAPHPDPEKQRQRDQLLQEVKALEQGNHFWKDVKSGRTKKNEAPAVRELRSKIKSLLEEIQALKKPSSDQDLRRLDAEEAKLEQELRD
jgi:hypothetical protein